MTKKKPFRAFNFACNKNEIELIQHIESKDNFTAYVKQLILNDMNGVTATTAPAKEEETKKLKRIDLKLKIWDRLRNGGYTLEQINRILKDEEIPYPQNNFQPIEQAKTTDTPKIEFESYGTTIINKPKKILQDDLTLRCMRCNRVIETRGFDFEQVNDYKKHVEETHGELFSTEREELSEILNAEVI